VMTIRLRLLNACFIEEKMAVIRGQESLPIVAPAPL
jgi:hypothetical protein